MGVPGAWALAGHRASLPQGTRTAARALLGCPCHGAPPLVIHGAEPALGTEPGRQSVALQRQRRQSRCKEGDFVFPFFRPVWAPRALGTVPLIHGLAVLLRSCLNIVEPV